MVAAEDMADAEPLFEAVEEDAAQPMEGVVAVQQEQPAAADQDSDMRGEYTWDVANFSKLEAKEYSPKFEIGTHLWRLLLCPRGLHAQRDSVAVYLDSPESGWVPDHLNPKASFKLTVVNQAKLGEDYSKESQHKWSKDASDWGFTQYLPYQDAINPDKGFLVNDTLKIKVEIQVLRDERYAYDSRQETGHVGLKNQGATCYMNSLLQYLYHLPYLRMAVYHMPTNENDEPSNSLPLALQSLFYKLQYSRTPVSTKDLTASFGWSTVDAFMQHDVQELNRVLCEKLEEKMKGTRVEKVINELFEGHTCNFLQCVNVDYKSSRRESFMDLQLDVKGCANIYASFDKYTEVEMMVGDNQYKAEGYGLQDARKGVLFDDFPPVLQLQLKRFEYDFQRDTMVKINDRYEFYDELDLDREGGKYLSPQADRSVRNLYKLHSVLVHSGGVHGGHYYAYIRPDGKQWLKFDDTSVTVEDDAKALEEQFGGDDDSLSGPRPMQTDAVPATAAAVNDANNPAEGAPVAGAPAGAAGATPAAAGAAAAAGPPKRLGGGTGLKFTRFSNAYMLVYVRVADWDRMMLPVAKDDIDPYLLQRLEADQRAKERRQKEKQEAHLYCHVRIATDQDIAQQVGHTQWFDLVDYDKLEPNRTFRVRKLTQFADFKKQVEEALGVPCDKQRYWVWHKRQNKTYRPTSRLKAAEEAQALVDLKEYRVVEERHANAKHALMDLRFYLEVPWPPTLQEQKVNRNEINLFFKYYDWQAEKLSYVGHRYVAKTLKVSGLYPLMRKLAGLPDNDSTPLLVFEEVKWDPFMVPPLEPNLVLGATGINQLEHGDIICFQTQPPADVLAAHQQQQQAAAAAAEAAATAVNADSMDVEQQQPLVKQEQQPLVKQEDDQQQQQQLEQQLSQQHLAPAQQQLQQQPLIKQEDGGVVQQQQQQQLVKQEDGEQQQRSRFPLVVDFLCYIRNRRLVTFKRLEDPKEPGLQLELLKEYSYDTVASVLASKLGVADPTCLRFTQHNSYSGQPQRSHIAYRSFSQLDAMLRHTHNPVDVVYYEVLDIPLPQLELLKTLRIQFHNDKTEWVAEHVLRAPRDGCVADVLAELAKRLAAAAAAASSDAGAVKSEGGSQTKSEKGSQQGQKSEVSYEGRQLRLLEVYQNKIYKVVDPSEQIGSWAENYWTLRAEPIPADETAPLAEGDTVIRVCHIAAPKPAPGAAAAAAATDQQQPADAPAAEAADAAAAAAAAPDAAVGSGLIGTAAAGPQQQQQQAVPFGDPFVLRIGARETVAQVRARIQQKLGVAAEEFESWRVAFVPIRTSPPQYLADDQVVAECFTAQTGVTAEHEFLALEHEDKGGPGGSRRPASSTSRYTYERAIKIHN